MSLTLDILSPKTRYEPRSELSGTVKWQLSAAPKHVDLRLFWFTSGIGDSDSEVVWSQRYDHPSISGEETFVVKLPPAPYSYSGRLISLCWSLEATAKGSDEVAVFDFVLSPFEDAAAESGGDNSIDADQ